MSRRGNIALYLLFALGVSTAVGYGVYLLLRERAREPVASADVGTPPPRPPARSVSRAAAPAPAPPQPVPASTPDADAAARAAVEPEDITDPDEDVVLLGTPGVIGALEPSQVERTIKRYMVRWERCMRRARERGMTERGDLRLGFSIGADGEVVAITYQATVDNELAICVRDVVRRLRFEKPGDGAPVTVYYPMRFVPARGERDPAAR